jgi:hypothetical protein
MPPEGPSSSPQFALRDALIFVLLTGFWMFLFGRVLGGARPLEERLANPHGVQAGASLAAIIVSVGFAALSLGLSHAHGRSATGRTFSLVLALAVAPSLILVLAWFVAVKRVPTLGETAYATLTQLRLAQQSYFAANGEYAPDSVALRSLSAVSQDFAVRGTSRPGETADVRSFRVLHAQGPHGPGGRKSFFTPGPDGRERLTEGFALVALPLDDRSTGIAIVVVTDGTAYAKRFGPDTAKIVSEMTEFDPDPTWMRVEP